MNPRTLLWVVAGLCIGGVTFAGPTSVPASNPPASQPGAEAPALTELQQNLLLQLSDAEANIQAINKALTRAGYSVGLAYNQIDSNLKGNDAMNRKGGGPVRWDAFYGKTARDFVMHDWGSPVYHQVQRPSQFNYIYQANNDQVARAKEQIANLAKDQATLLERRRKHEADQSRLWATLSWQDVKDREIGLHPLCRFALTPHGPDTAVLEPLILFLRTANQTTIEGLDALTADQSATFQATNTHVAAAYGTLQLALADVMDDPKLDPAHRGTAQAIKLLCKDLSEECKVITLNYANALDRDVAKQDTSKLEFRGQLQASLAKYANTVAQLDQEITNAAKSWGITVDRTTPIEDVRPTNGTAPIAAMPGSSQQAPGEFHGDAASSMSPLSTFQTVDRQCEFYIDTTRAPELREWAVKKLGPTLAEWYPKISATILSKGDVPPKNFSVSLEPLNRIASTAGTHIVMNSTWLMGEGKGSGLGAVIYQEVHIIQQYGRHPRSINWIIDGMCDYIRWYKFEPESHGADIKPADADRARYNDPPRPSANFLHYVTEKYDKQICRELNWAIRHGKYSDDIWKEHTGKTVEELGEEWKAYLAHSQAGN